MAAAKLNCTDGTKSNFFIRRENQINSSNWAHGYITRLTQIVWIQSPDISKICYDFITVNWYRPKYSSLKSFQQSFSFFRRFHFIKHSPLVLPPSSPAPQLNYIRFINLASSVSRRDGEKKAKGQEKEKMSHCVLKHISNAAVSKKKSKKVLRPQHQYES